MTGLGVVDKAAVLVVRLARNHPVRDGNTHAAWNALRPFHELNGWTWNPRPSIDEAEATVLAIAAGELDEQETGNWLRARLTPE